MNSHKNVAIFVDDIHGGAGKNAQIVANYLSNNSYNVTVVLLYPQDSMEVIRRNYKVVKHKIYNSCSPILDLTNAIQWIRSYILDNEFINVISMISNNSILVSLSILFNKKINFIISERNNILLNRRSVIYKFLQIISYFRANSIIVQFDFYKRIFHGYFANKTITISNSIIKQEKIQLNRSLSTIRFITCSRLEEIKRIDLMIKLFKKINTAVQNTELIICGDGKNRKNLEEIIAIDKLNDKVIILGKVDDVSSMLLDSDIYLSTSLSEGFPNSILEAISVGLPVIAFECHEGFREIISPNEGGFLIEMNNNELFINKSILLAQNKDMREKMSKFNLKHKNRFEETQILQTWINVLK